MTSLTPQELKVLEQTRQRLSLLTASLASLQQQIENSNPLPPWSTLLLSPQIISQHLSTLTTHLTTHAPLLSSLSVYPLPTYPGREKEAELNQLLRKKLEPGVEDWVEEGWEVGEGVEGGEGGMYGGERDGDGDGEGGWRGLWEWAGVAANEMARGVEWGDEEGEGDDGEEEEEEGDGGEEGEKGEKEGEGKAVPLEDVLRVLVRGVEGKK